MQIIASFGANEHEHQGMECNSAGSFGVMALWAGGTAERSSLNFLEYNKWAAVNFSLEEDFSNLCKYK